jgi:hypothetical protein
MADIAAQPVLANLLGANPADRTLERLGKLVQPHAQVAEVNLAGLPFLLFQR